MFGNGGLACAGGCGDDHRMAVIDVVYGFLLKFVVNQSVIPLNVKLETLNPKLETDLKLEILKFTYFRL